jgi:FAD/FMN-containing dehydrogenase
MTVTLLVITALGVLCILFIAVSKKRKHCADLTEPAGIAERAGRHEVKVKSIASQLKERKSTAPLVRHKKSVSHQVPKAKDLKYSDEKIEMGDFADIIGIDVTNRTCVAEPGVTFIDLVTATMRYGLVPIVVPELKTITIGGAVAGCSLESMSYMYGGFHDTCLEYEVVTAKGGIITCTPENEHRLLFQMIHGTFGTLGILTSLKFRLIPAKPFVKMRYEKYARLADYENAIRKHYENKDIDFMDGIIHSPREYVLSLGDFVDEAPYRNRYDWMKVYYISTRERSEDYIPTIDYFFRYDRGVTNVHPKSAVGRFFFGKLFGSTELLWLAEKFHWLLSSENPSINLDVFIPFSRFEEFGDWYSKTFDFYPLWCVPYRVGHKYEWLSERFLDKSSDELYLDLAIYGMKQAGEVNYHKIMEDKLIEIGGLKTLISHNYFSEEDFWKIWNKKNYYAVKAVTDPDNIFRDLYSKTCKASMGIESIRTKIGSPS